MSSLLPANRWLVKGTAKSQGIALTFDDGPHPEFTPRLLDELQQHQVRATFFVVGEAAERYPAIIRRISAEGHVLGTHTYTHSEPAATSTVKMLDEVRRSLDLIGDLTGSRPTLFRPPKGKLTIAKTLGLWKLGQSIVLWNRDPRDYMADAMTGILPWIEAYAPSRGDILLMHDNHPHCIAAIKPLVTRAALRELGQFAGIDEWIGSSN